MLIPLWLKVKAVTAEVVSDLGGNKVCAAAASRIDRHATFSDYANPNEIKRVIPLDTAIELDAFNLRAGKPARHIELAAAELNHMLVPMPVSGKGSAPLTRVTGQAMHRTAQVFSNLGAALENDGAIDLAEDRLLHADIVEAIKVLCALDEQITADRIAAEAAARGAP